MKSLWLNPSATWCWGSSDASGCAEWPLMEPRSEDLDGFDVIRWTRYGSWMRRGVNWAEEGHINLTDTTTERSREGNGLRFDSSEVIGSQRSRRDLSGGVKRQRSADWAGRRRGCKWWSSMKIASSHIQHYSVQFFYRGLLKKRRMQNVQVRFNAGSVKQMCCQQGFRYKELVLVDKISMSWSNMICFYGLCERCSQKKRAAMWSPQAFAHRKCFCHWQSQILSVWQHIAQDFLRNWAFY